MGHALGLKACGLGGIAVSGKFRDRASALDVGVRQHHCCGLNARHALVRRSSIDTSVLHGIEVHVP